MLLIGLVDEFKGRVCCSDGGALEQGLDGCLDLLGRVREDMPRGCASREPRRRRQESASRREERDGATMPSTRMHHGCPSSCCSLGPPTAAAVVGFAADVQGELNQCLSIGR